MICSLFSGMCVAVPHSDTTAHICFYVTKEKYRGRGIGRSVYSAATSQLGERNWCVTAEQSNSNLYHKLGFRIKSFNVQRHWVIPDVENLPTDDYAGSIKIVKPSEISEDLIEKFDVTIHPFKRDGVLPRRLRGCECAYVAVTDGVIRGVVAMMSATQGYKMEPWYATNPHIAKILGIKALEGIKKGEKVEVLVPEENYDALAVIKELGLQDAAPEVAYRMYSKEEVTFSKQSVYSLMCYDFYIV